MAHDLKRQWMLLPLLAVSAGMASAQGLSDPTRPPAELTAGLPAAFEGSSLLQSILISGGRKLAVINGQVVPLGGMYGNARLVRITPTEVTLQGEQAVEVMKLYPGVARTSAQPVRQAEQPASSPNRGER